MENVGKYTIHWVSGEVFVLFFDGKQVVVFFLDQTWEIPCWFQICLFSSILGEMIQFDEHIFQMAWNHKLLLMDEIRLTSWGW